MESEAVISAVVSCTDAMALRTAVKKPAMAAWPVCVGAPAGKEEGS